jgi:hypothetical protein
MASTGQLPGTGGGLKVLETTYLPSPNGKGRAAIHLVETLEGRQLLIGATDSQLSLLSESEDHSGRLRLRVSEALEQVETPFERILEAAAEKAPPAAPQGHSPGIPSAARDQDRHQQTDPQLTDALHRLRAARLRLETGRVAGAAEATT